MAITCGSCKVLQAAALRIAIQKRAIANVTAAVVVDILPNYVVITI